MSPVSVAYSRDRDATPVASSTSPPSSHAAVQENRDDLELSEGSKVRIGDFVCRIGSSLGMGSFGAVWAASSDDVPALAIKEIECCSHADLLNALFEGHLLRTFTPKGPRTPRQAGDSNDAEDDVNLARVLPWLVASETLHLGPQLWRVRLAMTRLPGKPLDCFLEHGQREDLHRRGNRDAANWRSLHKACFFAREMFSQLAPALKVVSSMAFHRDVNPHNILIELDDSEARPRFSLVDFGLAVDALCWQREEGSGWTMSRPSRVGQDGACTWHNLDVGGDCRYWPESAWVQFLHGWMEVESNPAWLFEYQALLDTHAFALTSVQMIAEMLPPFRDCASMDASSDPGGVWASFRAMQLAWDVYYETVTPLHTRLMDTFHHSGDWDSLKLSCIDKNVETLIADHVGELRTAIQIARDRCIGAPAECGVSGLGGLFSALLLLLGGGDPTDHLQGPQLWKEVVALLDPEDNSRISPKSPLCVPRPITSSASTASTMDAPAHTPRSRAFPAARPMRVPRQVTAK